MQTEGSKKISDLPSVLRWPVGAFVYHIYPRSLQDSNGDGIGDLNGITSRLDYLKELGVNVIWLSPFYVSPMADFGYDIADYCDVEPIFGDMDDFKKLLAETHKRDMRMMVDFVPNHTSDEHEWFQQSRKSKDNPYTDWYIWRDPHGFTLEGKPLPPNNWRDALTGGSAWEWVPEREQFYLHSFDVKQPDLKWSNPDVREAIKNAMRFWLNLGVDGFRVDAVYWMGKDTMLRDDSLNPDYLEGEDPPYEELAHNNSLGWPMIYSYLSEMGEVLKEEPYRERRAFMVTEAYPERHNTVDAYMSFYYGINPEVAAPFNFEGISLGWNARDWHRFLKSFHGALHEFSPYCVPSYAFGNHDQPRLISRIGEPAAKSAAVMLLTLPGMAFVYYGEEIGMRDVHIPDESIQDPAAKGDAKYGQGRDPERTPMQWTPGRNAGFSDGESTWLPLAPDYETCNVEVQRKDPNSFFNLYKTLGQLRARCLAIKHGSIDILDVDNPHVVAYIREDETERYLIAINFSEERTICRFNGYTLESVVASTHANALQASLDELVLQPHEGTVFRVS